MIREIIGNDEQADIVILAPEEPSQAPADWTDEFSQLIGALAKMILRKTNELQQYSFDTAVEQLYDLFREVLGIPLCQIPIPPDAHLEADYEDRCTSNYEPDADEAQE